MHLTPFEANDDNVSGAEQDERRRQEQPKPGRIGVPPATFRTNFRYRS